MTTFNIVNFRELGGLETKEGKQIQTNRLIRSGELVGLTQTTTEALEQQFKLTKIIDLRGKREVEERPDDTLVNVQYEWIDIMKKFDDLGTSLDDISHLSAADAAVQGMTLFYQKIIMNKGAQEGYRQYFEELLTTEEGSVLFHCFAGKDRTGIAAALTLELLDVPSTTIYQDYLVTNQMRKKANEILLEQARQEGKTEEELAGMEVGLCVRKEYLEAAYEEITQNYGDVATYAKEVLNIGKSEIADLKKLYLK